MTGGYHVNKTIPLPPREAFPQAPAEVWTATGKKLEAAPPVRKGKGYGPKRLVDASFIAEERKARGMTQAQLTAAMGLGKGVVANWEHRKAMSAKFADRARKWFLAHPVGAVVEEAVAPPAPQPAAVYDYKGDPVRVARKKALQVLDPMWSEAKQIGFLAGLEAMEDAIMEELG